MDRELLIEVGCEEIPASWLPPLTAQFGQHLDRRLKEARLTTGGRAEAFSTPRRLAARVTKLAERQTDLEELFRGLIVSLREAVPADWCALHELPRPVVRFAGTRELRCDHHHQEAATKAVLSRSVGDPGEPFAGHRVQAIVESRPHDQLGLEPLRQCRIAGIEALDRSLEAVRSFEQIDVLGEVRICERERNFRRRCWHRESSWRDQQPRSRS